jgi:hypothetical protein
MITQYDVTKKLEIRGEIADLQLGIRAIGVESKDAIAANDAFDRFLSTISGTAHKTASALKKESPAPSAAAADPKSLAKVKVTTKIPRKVRAGINAQNGKSTPWAPEERVVINRHLTDKDATAVQKDYRKTFPDSTRNDNSVYLKWYSTVKTAKKAAKQAQEKSGDEGSRIQKPDSAIKTPPEDPAKGVRPQEIHIPTQQADRDWVKVPNAPITVGTTVKHNGTKHSPFFGQVGTIAKVGDGQQVLVNFGDAGSTWVMQSDVIVVTKSARAEVSA